MCKFIIMLVCKLFDVRHSQTSDYIRTSLVVLPENMSIYSRWNFVDIMDIYADIYVTSYLLPVNVRHL